MSKKGGVKGLPSDCWLMIFRLLSDTDLKAVSMCCKAFLATSSSLKKSLRVVHPEISMLSQHLQRFCQLKNIDVSDFEGDKVEAIREIRRSGISLEALAISTHHEHFAELMESLRGLPSNLKALNCEIRTERDDEDDVDVDVGVIANTFPSLEQLQIVAPDEMLMYPNPIGIGFESIASKLKLLKKILLCSCKVDDQFIIALSLNCVLLKDIAIVHHHYVTETGVGHLLRNRPNLEALAFDAHPEPEEEEEEEDSSSIINIENSIGHNKALTSLELYWMSDIDKVFMAIAKAKFRLNTLSLNCCSDLSASDLLVVLSNHHLTKLSLRGGTLDDITDEDMKLLLLKGNVSNLTSIDLEGCQLTSSTLFLLSTSCPSLVDIRMDGAELSKPMELDIVPFSKNHKKMTCLQLDNCRGMNDEFLKQLGLLFPNLKVLQLSYFQGSCIGIEAILKSFKHINELNVCGDEYNNAESSFEVNDPELVELNLQDLTLRYSSIDDEGLAAIAKICPRLVSLELSNCRNITREGIKQAVQNTKILTYLSFDG